MPESLRLPGVRRMPVLNLSKLLKMPEPGPRTGLRPAKIYLMRLYHWAAQRTPWMLFLKASPSIFRERKRCAVSVICLKYRSVIRRRSTGIPSRSIARSILKTEDLPIVKNMATIHVSSYVSAIFSQATPKPHFNIIKCPAAGILTHRNMHLMKHSFRAIDLLITTETLPGHFHCH